MGEALGQAQRVAAEREPLARLLAGEAASQLGDIGRMFAKLTDAHAASDGRAGPRRLAPLITADAAGGYRGARQGVLRRRQSY